ncbi:hypothetical protein FMEAI12_3550036 [Parafrankia sp. Ea1.12]|nr:hypothetical protein FMEAI12_3550036 [Parafrankia sp. Ea1.12]
MIVKVPAGRRAAASRTGGRPVRTPGAGLLSLMPGAEGPMTATGRPSSAGGGRAEPLDQVGEIAQGAQGVVEVRARGRPGEGARDGAAQVRGAEPHDALGAGQCLGALGARQDPGPPHRAHDAGRLVDRGVDPVLVHDDLGAGRLPVGVAEEGVGPEGGGPVRGPGTGGSGAGGLAADRDEVDAAQAAHGMGAHRRQRMPPERVLVDREVAGHDHGRPHRGLGVGAALGGDAGEQPLPLPAGADVEHRVAAGLRAGVPRGVVAEDAVAPERGARHQGRHGHVVEELLEQRAPGGGRPTSSVAVAVGHAAVGVGRVAFCAGGVGGREDLPGGAAEAGPRRGADQAREAGNGGLGLDLEDGAGRGHVVEDDTQPGLAEDLHLARGGGQQVTADTGEVQRAGEAVRALHHDRGRPPDGAGAARRCALRRAGGPRPLADGRVGAGERLAGAGAAGAGAAGILAGPGPAGVRTAGTGPAGGLAGHLGRGCLDGDGGRLTVRHARTPITAVVRAPAPRCARPRLPLAVAPAGRGQWPQHGSRGSRGLLGFPRYGGPPANHLPRG